MSYRTIEDRRMLKARRSTKFESTSAITNYIPNSSLTTTDTIRMKGFKRPCDEVNKLAPKKFCNGLQSFTASTCTTKNLAHNRLQRLKQTLKSDIEQNCNSKEVPSKSGVNSSNGPTVSVSEYSPPKYSRNICPNLHNQMVPHTTNAMENLTDKSLNSDTSSKINNQSIDEQTTPLSCRTTTHIADESKHTEGTPKYREPHSSQTPLKSSQYNSKSIYQNLDKWANPPDKYPAKNLANQRLNRLKKVVNNIKSPTNEFKPVKYPDDDESPSNNEKTIVVNDNLPCSLVNNTKSGTKRIIDDCYKSDVECSPVKKSSPFIHKSPLLRTNHPESYYIQSPHTQNIDRQLGNNVSSPEGSIKPSFNISNRIMKIKKNMETINTSYHNNDVSNNQETIESDSGQVCFKKSTIESQGMELDLKHKSCNISFDSTTDIATLKNIKSDSNNETPKSTTISHRINLNRNVDNNHNISYSQLNTSDSNFKSYLEPLEQENHSETENFDNYKGKWKMTAAWVWNHQNINGTPEQSKTTVSSKPTTVEPIPEEMGKSNDMDEMEWTNAEPDSEMIEASQKLEHNNMEKKELKDPTEVEKLKELCIVVDTNVFISGLSKVKDIMNMKLTEPILPIIYVPWMVITELDYMKHNCSDDKLKQKVTNAVKFINTTLENENPRFLGQTINDMEKQKSVGISPDDKIVSCCLQALEKYETVILLSNDLNLRSKALINNIFASSANEIIMKIMSKTTKTVKSQKVMQKMSVLCSSVICECAKETYGEVWLKMDLLSNPPWSLRECLKRFRKYWPTVFQDKMMKQFTMTVDQLLTIFQRNRYFADDSEDYVKFMKLCIQLCIFLKDINQCKGSVENILRDITKI